MKHLFLLVVVSIVAVSCKTTRNLHSKEFLRTQQELTEKLTQISKTTSFNGFGVALVNDKEVLYQNGFGISNIRENTKYTESTVQNIASVSKTVIGIAILKAQELGHLNLDEPVSKYLPFNVFNPEHPEVPITIRHLVTHTSSIVDTEEYLTRNVILKDTINLVQNLNIDISPTRFNPPSTKISLEDFLKNLLDTGGAWYTKEAFSTKEPGSTFEYSNVGASLAALVLEKAVGTTYDAFTTQYILLPLKMNSSGWSFDAIDFSKYSPTYQDKQTPYPYYSLVGYPDGGLLTTSSDMGKYILELMKGYFGNGTLLSEQSYKEYFTPQLTAENFINRSTSEYSDEYNMGITMGFGSTGNFGHTGGDPGMSSVIWFFKDKRMGRYFIVNTDWDSNSSGKDQKAIYDLLDDYYIRLNSLSKSKK
ncbi:serine hydrolase domain-containing protein [Pontibacter lucknowensis]|uniref:CubicO group peptidase, beta-lactamase class C family n=1 Tax=Pontibacter lucknowensis TaxID=1077936 RepID=A0A1N6ZHB7_9BACT|nr:serine hydrolase domain-containing protein [Pontibacter lucknowensis]SIR26213.1 CubicO group peptidase, beta-lactamase class C family [Pontibacter lucknowensis]